jgi:glutamine cyclotransferase
MKNIILSLSAIMIVLAFSACQKNQSDAEIFTENSDNVTFINDQALLDARIEKVNVQVDFGLKSTTDLNYTWVANILPITSGGVVLSASTVDAFDNVAYVGWHARGSDIVGEVSVVSVEDPLNPVMIQYGVFPNQEFNDLEVKPNVSKIFFAGQATKTMSGESVGDNNAFGMSFNISASGLVQTMNWENYLPGYSANSITYVANQTIWLSKGSQGGLTVFRDYDLSDVKYNLDVANAKHFDATGDYGVLLNGVGFNESQLTVWDMNSLYAPMTQYTIPYDVTHLGKNAVDINYEFAYLAMGNDGIVKIDLTNGDVVKRFDYENGGFANGVTVDFRYVYAAYGSDGLFVLDKETFDVVGHWNFNGSCNYAKRTGDFLYIANGSTDGMIILKKD